MPHCNFHGSSYPSGIFLGPEGTTTVRKFGERLDGLTRVGLRHLRSRSYAVILLDWNADNKSNGTKGPKDDAEELRRPLVGCPSAISQRIAPEVWV